MNPFVLLDDARSGSARLYRAPRFVIRADAPEAVDAALTRMRAATAAGLHLAGFLSYDAASAFEPRAAARRGPGPVLWFGAFDRWETVAAETLLPPPEGAWAGAPEPELDAQAYAGRVRRVLDWIEAGDIYQANFTYRASIPFAGDPLALYARLRERARGAFGAVVATGDALLLSLSPELFFALEGRALTVRPMKGTVARGGTPAQDRELRDSLAQDPKQRAENLMILDLMRNDLSRVARPGTVRTPEQFTVETYPSLHTMTSTATAELAPGLDALDALAALFPCGSVTGAPKLRAMEIIDTLETSARGIYTGSIGRIDASGDAMFNVAIRTLHLDGRAVAEGKGRASLGLGGGIVADSHPGAEWSESLLKGAFVTAGQRAFDLIETMAFDPVDGILLLERHLERMKDSAESFGFPFDRHETRNELQAATFRLRAPHRVRLLLSPGGAIAIGLAPAPSPMAQPLRVALAPLPVSASDFRLRHKTTDRDFYDATRRASGADEVLFVDTDGRLTEGSFTSLFVPRGDTLATPPAELGLLPGVLRAELLANGRAFEAELRAEDLRGEFFVGNALRGLMRAVAVEVAAAL